MSVFLNMNVLLGGLLAPRPTSKVEDHPFSTDRESLLNLLSSTLLMGGRSSKPNLRTRHAEVTGGQNMDIIAYIIKCIYTYAHT